MLKVQEQRNMIKENEPAIHLSELRIVLLGWRMSGKKFSRQHHPVSGGTPSEDGSSVYSAEAHAKANILMTNKVNKWLGQLSTDVSVIEPTRKTRTNTGSIDFPLPSNETPVVDKMAKKRSFEEDDLKVGVGNEVQTMLERFGADISKAMQAKRKRLETFTKSSLKGSNQKLEQLWNTQYAQRQKLTQEYSQQVSSVLQQWEIDAQKSEDQEEKLNNLFRQQQKLFQQARVVQSQKLKTIKELYEQFIKNMEEMEKSHETFLQGAQVELKKEMAVLQKKVMMDTQQQEMATVRKSLQSMLF